MKATKILMMASLLAMSSIALAEGGADRTFERMFQAHEKSMAEYAQSQGKAAPQVKKYTYGMNLDIARVINETPSNTCGVIPVQMTYEDSKGDMHTLQYLVHGSGCSDGG